MSLLDNPIWGALTTEQAYLANSLGDTRCFPDDISLLCAVKTPTHSNFQTLSTLVGDDIDLILFTEGEPDLPSGWEISISGNIVQMLLKAPIKAQKPTGIQIVPLGEADVTDMLELTTLTRPGPFAERTRLLGNYLGIWQDGQLAAMAGERLHLPGYREISAVCTHPDFQGKGYARLLLTELTNMMFERGETPFLHVYDGNPRAIHVYKELGFEARTTLRFTGVKPRLKSPVLVGSA